MQDAAVDLGLLIAFASLTVALVATGIAVWQGQLSRRQLELARETQGKTEDALKEIRDLTAETRHLTREVKTSIDDRITRIIDREVAGSEAVPTIPEDGFVLSGRGGARTWLLAHAEVGAGVETITV